MAGSYLTSGQVARLLGISKQTVFRLVAAGELRAAFRMPGGAYRFLALEVERYAQWLREAAEVALRHSEKRYRRIVETANEGIIEASLDHRIVGVNPRMAEMLGQPTLNFIAEDVPALFPPAQGAAALLLEAGAVLGPHNILPWAGEYKARTAIVVPIRVHDETYGFLWIGSVTPMSYTRRHTELAQAFAERVGQALWHAAAPHGAGAGTRGGAPGGDAP